MAMRRQGRPLLVVLAVLTAASPIQGSDVDAYIDEFAGFDVGESPRYSNAEQLPLTLHVTSPISSGLLVGPIAPRTPSNNSDESAPA